MTLTIPKPNPTLTTLISSSSSDSKSTTLPFLPSKALHIFSADSFINPRSQPIITPVPKRKGKKIKQVEAQDKECSNSPVKSTQISCPESSFVNISGEARKVALSDAVVIGKPSVVLFGVESISDEDDNSNT